MRSHFGRLRSIPFAFYRSGTSRGIYVLESDVPPKGPERDALLCRLMGSGHPRQIGGFGGGTGPTSKAVIVGTHPEAGTVTYTFAQCRVDEALVDHSHGDCGNMLAAVAPFALERGLVELGQPPATWVRIHSTSTGSTYEAQVCTGEVDDEVVLRYSGDLSIPGVPATAAPVQLSAFGVAGSQTGHLLPTGRAVDLFDLGQGLGEVSATIIDFARALVMLDADEVLPKFGYTASGVCLKTLEADASLNEALEHVRCAASLSMGLGDCAGKDSPKVALLASHQAPALGTKTPSLACSYWVTPERQEIHPTVALTAAQAIAAACLLQRSIARRLLGEPPTSDGDETHNTFSLSIAHAAGLFPVTVGTRAAARGSREAELFPQGIPNSGNYTTTVMPIAEGRAFV